MAFVHGKNATFSLNGTDISSYTEEVTFSRPVDTAEVTTLGDSDKAYLAGMRDSTLSLSGPWEATVDALVEPLLGSTNNIGWVYSPDGGTTTYTGNCIVSSYEVGTPVGDKASWSAELQNTADVTRV
jgi:hypothetical protein